MQSKDKFIEIIHGWDNISSKAIEFGKIYLKEMSKDTFYSDLIVDGSGFYDLDEFNNAFNQGDFAYHVIPDTKRNGIGVEFEILWESNPNNFMVLHKLPLAIDDFQIFIDYETFLLSPKKFQEKMQHLIMLRKLTE